MLPSRFMMTRLHPYICIFIFTFTRPAFRRIEIETIPRVDDAKLIYEYRVVMQPGAKILKGRMAESIRAISTRWREFKVDMDDNVRKLRCKERFSICLLIS